MRELDLGIEDTEVFEVGPESCLDGEAVPEVSNNSVEHVTAIVCVLTEKY